MNESRGIIVGMAIGSIFWIIIIAVLWVIW